MINIKEDNFLSMVRAHAISQNTLYNVTALAGEVGEVANIAKKEILYSKIARYKEIVDNEIKNGSRTEFKLLMLDEMSDVLFYLVALADTYGYTLSNLMDTQWDKLLKRDEVRMKETGLLFQK